jgi:dephospho-CoA kinase
MPGAFARRVQVVAFTGMPGAGKSEAVEVARARGIPVVRMGDLVWEEVKRRGLPLDKDSVATVASEMRTSYGMDVWAVRTCRRVQRDHAQAAVVVVDGVRNWEEVDRLRQELGDVFHLVAITSAPEERLSRLTVRGREDDAAEPADVTARDERELGWGIAKAIAMADSVLTNEGPLDAFRVKVAGFLDAFTVPS